MFSINETINLLSVCTTEQSRSILKELIQSKTIEHIGSGYFSYVFKHLESNTVIKVVLDYGTKRIYEFLKENYNPGLPEIYGIYKSLDCNSFIVTSKEYKKYIDGMDEDIKDQITNSIRAAFNRFTRKQEFEDFASRLHFNLDTKIFFNKENCVNLFNIISKLTDFMEKNLWAHPDYKEDNIMFDGDTIILNDPLWNMDHDMRRGLFLTDAELIS